MCRRLDYSAESTKPFSLLSNTNEIDKGLSKCDVAKMSHFYTAQFQNNNMNIKKQ